MFGDGVYEVISSYQGKLFQTEQHLERLSYSLAQINLEYDVSTIPDRINSLIDKTSEYYRQFLAGHDITIRD